MSYINNLTLKPRRHPVKRLTGPEAIAKLNSVVDEANKKIARMRGEAEHIQAVATEELHRLYDELAAVRADRDGLQRRVDELEVEVRRLRKRTRKSKRVENGLEGEE